ncbi:MAG TPA: hypothetical protein VG652_02110 [Gaiellaceae bacterium]|nr:hypothetical protein [Gaiellaceae bacterium]
MRPASAAVRALVGAATLVLAAAACGGHPSDGHVAQLASTTTSTSTRAGALPGVDGAIAFSRCMRSHGVPAYPDPGSDGTLPKKTPQQLGVGSSEFQHAQGACIHLVPNGGRPTQIQVQQYRSTMLIYAHCIRSHGVANFPDPDSRGHLDIGPGTAVDLNSPQFQAAYQACKSRLSP